MEWRGGRRRGEDGIAVVIDFLLSNARLVLGVGGAAILGIATLAVKRLIERAGRAAEDEKVEQKMVESWEELTSGPASPSLGSASPKMIRKGLEGVVRKHVTAATKQRKGALCQQKSSLDSSPGSGLQLQVRSDHKPKPETRKSQLSAPPTLQERLQHFYRSKVELPEEEVTRVQQVALAVCTEVQVFLHTHLPHLPLGPLSLAGSLLDGLQVVRADHVCVLVPVALEEELWSLVPGEETLLAEPLVWVIRRTSLEFRPRGASPWDRFLVGGYLSSEALVSMLSKAVMETLNWPSLSDSLECLVRPVLGGRGLALEISSVLGGVSLGAEPLWISMVPVVREGDVVLTAQPEMPCPWPGAWRLSLYPWETRELHRRDQLDHGARRTSLKILKAVCRLNPALRPLGSAPLASLVLHLSDREPDWSEGALEARFRQCVAELIGYLERGALPSYVWPAVNLLAELSQEQVEQLGWTLYCSLHDPGSLLG